MWFLSSEEFLGNCKINKSGKNKHTKAILFNDTKAINGDKKYILKKIKKYEV